MQKELKDITEEDIKQVWTDAGGVVSWQNCLLPLGLYAYIYPSPEIPVQRGPYEVTTMVVDSLNNLTHFIKKFVDDFSGKITMKYYTHNMVNDELHIRFSYFPYDAPFILREATKQEIIDSFIDPRSHPNHQDLKHFYNLYE